MTKFAVKSFITESCTMKVLAREILQVVRKLALYSSMAIISQEELAKLIFQIRRLFSLLELFALLGSKELVLLFLLVLFVFLLFLFLLLSILVVLSLFIAFSWSMRSWRGCLTVWIEWGIVRSMFNFVDLAIFSCDNVNPDLVSVYRYRY